MRWDENKYDWYHTLSYHGFRDSRLQFTSVRLIVNKTVFFAVIQCFLRKPLKRFRFLIIQEKIILKYWSVHDKSRVYNFECLGSKIALITDYRLITNRFSR